MTTNKLVMNVESFGLFTCSPSSYRVVSGSHACVTSIPEEEPEVRRRKIAELAELIVADNP